MNKIKDFLYDTNDILVAVIILLCAGFVIVTRIDDIMSFPEMSISDGRSQGGHISLQPAPVPTPVPTDSDDDDDPADDDSVVSDDDPVNYSLYIAYGQSMNEIADNIVKLGFFKDRQEFLEYIENHGAATSVQAGDFIIPSDSTKDEVIKIILGN